MNQAECSAMESTADSAKRLVLRQRSCIREIAGGVCEHEAAMQAERVPCHVAIDDKPFSEYTDEQCVLVLASLLYQDDKRRGGYPYSVNPTEILLRSSSQRSLETVCDRLEILRSRYRRLDFIWAALDRDGVQFGKRVSRYESMKSRCDDEIQSLVGKIKDIHDQGGPSVGFETHGVWNYVDHLLKVSMDEERIAQAKQRGEAFVERAMRESELPLPNNDELTEDSTPPKRDNNSVADSQEGGRQHKDDAGVAQLALTAVVEGGLACVLNVASKNVVDVVAKAIIEGIERDREKANRSQSDWALHLGRSKGTINKAMKRVRESETYKCAVGTAVSSGTTKKNLTAENT